MCNEAVLWNTLEKNLSSGKSFGIFCHVFLLNSPLIVNHLLFQIPISLSNVGFVPLYGGNQAQKILALFAPEDSLTGLFFASFFKLRILNSNC